MRTSLFQSQTLPAIRRIGGLCVLLVTCVTAAEAAPGAGPTPRSPRSKATSCDVRTPTLRTLRLMFPSFGPVASRSKRTAGTLIDATPRVRHGAYAPVSGDDQAIQNDAPAASVEHDDAREPGLRPIGVLAGSFDRLPTDARFSPRSPRGPPAVI